MGGQAEGQEVTKSGLVTLGADVGGEDADAATDQHVRTLRQLLKQECRGRYGSTFDEFAFVLRIDGAVQSWRKSGVDHVRLQRKAKYATADIFVPSEVWNGPGRSGRLRRFLATQIVLAAEQIASRAEKAGDSIDALRFTDDVRKAVKKFLR